MVNPFWTQSIPVWVSRKTSEGLIVTWNLTGWLFFLIGMLLTANILGWSVVGLVELVQYVLNAL